MSDIELVDHSLQTISLVILLASRFQQRTGCAKDACGKIPGGRAGGRAGGRDPDSDLKAAFTLPPFSSRSFFSLSLPRRYATPTTLLYFVVDPFNINICCRPKTWVVCGWGRHACERDDGERLLLS